MKFQVILTSLALATSLMVPQSVMAKSPARTPTLDELVLDMGQAHARGDRKTLSAMLPKFRGHVLEPWAAYWELNARLDDASLSDIRAFLNRYAGTYQEDRLRNDWLLLLGKRRDWAAFSVELPLYRMNDDASVRCYALMAESMATEVDIAQRVQDLWLAQREPEEGCTAAVAQQLKAEKLKPHAVWLRARLAFEYDRPLIARQAVALLKPEYVATINSIYAHPARYLDSKFTAILPQTKELVTLALIRLADKDLGAAAAELDKLRWKLQLTQEEFGWIWGVIGKRAARLLSDDALGYYTRGNPDFMHDEHLLWRVRAALRAKDWLQVQDAIGFLSESQLRDPTWIYWRARALLELRAPNAEMRANALYQTIASQRGFYEQLAMEELGQRISAPTPPEPLTEAEKLAARNNPGLKRAMHAIQIGLRSEGVREWNYSIVLHTKGGMTDRELLAAAHWACEQQVWDRCINTSERTRTQIDVAQRFPMPFRSDVLRRAGEAGLDPAYVYGLIRQESRFIADAQSGVGAAGLMQVMPATARWTAQKIGMKGYKPRNITDRDTNITLGTSYLKLVLEAFDGSLPLAAAAYNAGPNRVRSWRAQDRDQALDAAIWTENVPFHETRDYVKKVLSNATNYAILISGESQSLKERLGTVGSVLQVKAEPQEDIP